MNVDKFLEIRRDHLDLDHDLRVLYSYTRYIYLVVYYSRRT